MKFIQCSLIIHYLCDLEQNVCVGEWYKGDVMSIIKSALATGGEPNTSDAYTINGQPGDLYACSKGNLLDLISFHTKALKYYFAQHL